MKKLLPFLLGSLLLSGSGVMAQNVGIGQAAPVQKLDINGAIRIGTTATDAAGSIRYNAGTFEGYNGSVWIPFGGAFGNAGGDLTGTYPNPTIATGAVTSTKILDGTITNADIANGTINLTQKVTGVLPIANGGTNTNALGPAGTIAYSNGTAYAFTTPGTAGQVLVSGGFGAPTWATAPVGSGTTNYLARWTPNGSTLGIGVTYDNGTNVGIGTTAPADKLHVNGGNLRITNGDWTGIWLQNTAGGGNLITLENNASALAALRIWNQSAGTGLVEVKYNGQVGIGTTAPIANARLQVVGGAIVPAVGNANTAGLSFPPDPGGGSGDLAFLRYYVEAGENTKLLIGNDNDLDDDIAFYQLGAERMNIYNGNVGIGNTTPAYKLDVWGKERIRVAGNDMSSSNNGQLEISNAGVGSAFISFHNEGSWGAHFGLEGDGWFSTRGWSPGGYNNMRVGNLEVYSNLGYGTSLSNTLTRDNAGLQGNAGARSGFYETSAPANYYAGASSWQHLIEARHSNPANNYAMQFAGSFFDQRLFFRKTNNNASQPWREVVLIPTKFVPVNGAQEGSVRVQITNGVLQLQNFNEGGALIWQNLDVFPGQFISQANIALTITNDDTGNCGTARVSSHRDYGTIYNNGGWSSQGTDMGCSGSDGHNLMFFISAY